MMETVGYNNLSFRKKIEGCREFKVDTEDADEYDFYSTAYIKLMAHIGYKLEYTRETEGQWGLSEITVEEAIKVMQCFDELAYGYEKDYTEVLHLLEENLHGRPAHHCGDCIQIPMSCSACAYEDILENSNMLLTAIVSSGISVLKI